MITLHLEAQTLDELREKALAAVGFGETAGRYTHSDESKAAPAVEEAAKRTRRTKEQIAAQEARTSLPNEPADSATSASGSTSSEQTSGSTAGSTAVQTASPPPTDLPGDRSSNEDSETGPVRTYYNEVVKPAVLRVSQAKGRPGVEALLAPYEVVNASHVKARDYPALLAAVDAAVGE